MSAWRREAIERLPECRRIAEEAENPMALWIELLSACEEAYANNNEDLIRRFYEFARWCWKSPSDEVRSAVACAFYEHLPTRPAMRRDMPRRVGRAAFAELREVFGYHLSPEEAAAFEQEFLEAEKKFVKEIL
ncbi:MAG: DUF7674 family protein [Limisphaerales bacterium]